MEKSGGGKKRKRNFYIKQTVFSIPKGWFNGGGILFILWNIIFLGIFLSSTFDPSNVAKKIPKKEQIGAIRNHFRSKIFDAF